MKRYQKGYTLVDLIAALCVLAFYAGAGILMLLAIIWLAKAVF